LLSAREKSNYSPFNSTLGHGLVSAWEVLPCATDPSRHKNAGPIEINGLDQREKNPRVDTVPEHPDRRHLMTLLFSLPSTFPLWKGPPHFRSFVAFVSQLDLTYFILFVVPRASPK